MKLSVWFRSILSITLGTLLPVFEFSRISPNDRIREFEKMHTLKLRVIHEFIFTFQSLSALNFLNNYVLNENEIYKFAKHVNASGHVPLWANSHKLENPKLYQSLRYDTSIEFIPSNLNELMERATKLQTTIFRNSPQFSIEELCAFYMIEYLNELISFDDYYALLVFLNGNKKLGLHTTENWRIKKALYSLAIRQYSPHLISTFSPVICYILMPGDLNYMRNDHTDYKDFTPCSKHNRTILSKIYSSSSSSTRQWLFYKILITDPRLIVDMEVLTKNDKDNFYVIIPNSVHKTVNEAEILNTSIGLVLPIEMNIALNIKDSKWQAIIAKKIVYFRVRADI